MHTKTRRECIPAGSGAASLLLTVLVNMSVSGTQPSQIALGVAEIGVAQIAHLSRRLPRRDSDGYAPAGDHSICFASSTLIPEPFMKYAG